MIGRRRLRPVVSMAVALVVLTSGALGARQGAAGDLDARPNIVVFYMDDVSPHDGRLWSNAALTPNIYHTFVEHGLHFTNAFGESPLCCPGRASLLTGLHTHNNGVYRNNIHLMHPTANVATELRGSGYETYWLGKYLNVFEKTPVDDWAQYVKPWTAMEATYLFSQRVRTATGWKETGLHPTTYITNQAVQVINSTPADTPFFGVFAPYNLHYPNKPRPMPAETFAQCDSIAPWKPPNYNEADVSDKPLYVSSRSPLPAVDGWSLVTYCQEMFGVDALVGDVISALTSTGRLDNTLLVFTADNGMNWGAHRLGAKSTPYATPVPLYMSWPARWGTEQRDVDEFVTNIDFAPTFCDLGACELGPYPSGQSGPDGVSLLPLLDGDVSNLGRDAILETIDGQTDSTQPWHALRTTALNSLGLWHYVEYQNGEKELYDIESDPWELENVAGDPIYADVRAALAVRLNELLQEGRVNGPDLAAWLSPSIMHGYNILGGDLSAQTERAIRLKAGVTRNFSVQLDNNSNSSDTFTLKATATNKPQIPLTFLVNGVDKTAELFGASGYHVSLIGSQRQMYVLRATIKSGTVRGVRRQVVLSATSSAYGATDRVQIIVGR